jgi:multiple sugar transport system permease protein
MGNRAIKGIEGRRERGMSRVLVYAALIVLSGLYLAPLVWMVSTAIKPQQQTLTQPPVLLPTPVAQTPEFAAQNFSDVWNNPIVDFPLYLRNTLIIAFLSVTGTVLSSAAVAYGFARIEFRGRGFLFALLLATMMIPFPVIMGPLYVLFRELGWIGSLKPLWVPAWFAGAFNVFMLRQFIRSIPKELDEAARIDGCGHFGIFWRIILPLSRPSLAVVALFQFMFVWNDFLGPLIFLQHKDQFTLALGLALFQSQIGSTPWNQLMMASLMIVTPVLILFLMAQRTFVEGIATAGLKE